MLTLEYPTDALYSDAPGSPDLVQTLYNNIINNYELSCEDAKFWPDDRSAVLRYHAEMRKHRQLKLFHTKYANIIYDNDMLFAGLPSP